MLFLQQQSDSLYILCRVAVVAGGGFFTQAGWGALSNFGSTENSNSGFPDGAPLQFLNWCVFLQAGARERERVTYSFKEFGVLDTRKQRWLEGGGTVEGKRH